MIGGPLALVRDLGRAVDAAARRLRGEYDEDEWGYDASSSTTAGGA